MGRSSLAAPGGSIPECEWFALVSRLGIWVGEDDLAFGAADAEQQVVGVVPGDALAGDGGWQGLCEDQGGAGFGEFKPVDLAVVVAGAVQGSVGAPGSARATVGFEAVEDLLREDPAGLATPLTIEANQ